MMTSHSYCYHHHYYAAWHALEQKVDVLPPSKGRDQTRDAGVRQLAQHRDLAADGGLVPELLHQLGAEHLRRVLGPARCGAAALHMLAVSPVPRGART